MQRCGSSSSPTCASESVNTPAERGLRVQPNRTHDVALRNELWAFVAVACPERAEDVEGLVCEALAAGDVAPRDGRHLEGHVRRVWREDHVIRVLVEEA